jgi:hypothetical protein
LSEVALVEGLASAPAGFGRLGSLTTLGGGTVFEVVAAFGCTDFRVRGITFIILMLSVNILIVFLVLKLELSSSVMIALFLILLLFLLFIIIMIYPSLLLSCGAATTSDSVL